MKEFILTNVVKATKIEPWVEDLFIGVLNMTFPKLLNISLGIG